MAVSDVSEDGAYVSCPECFQRVDYYPHGSSGLWHWACHATGTASYRPLDEGFEAALNTCRPCPWVSCRHNLYLEVNQTTGTMKKNFPDREPWELEETCALDVAERGGMTLKEVGDILNLTRERIRQLELKAMEELGLPIRKMNG